MPANPGVRKIEACLGTWGVHGGVHALVLRWRKHMRSAEAATLTWKRHLDPGFSERQQAEHGFGIFTLDATDVEDEWLLRHEWPGWGCREYGHGNARELKLKALDLVRARGPFGGPEHIFRGASAVQAGPTADMQRHASAGGELRIGDLVPGLGVLLHIRPDGRFAVRMLDPADRDAEPAVLGATLGPVETSVLGQRRVPWIIADVWPLLGVIRTASFDLLSLRLAPDEAAVIAAKDEPYGVLTGTSSELRKLDVDRWLMTLPGTPLAREHSPPPSDQRRPTASATGYIAPEPTASATGKGYIAPEPLASSPSRRATAAGVEQNPASPPSRSAPSPSRPPATTARVEPESPASPPSRTASAPSPPRPSATAAHVEPEPPASPPSRPAPRPPQPPATAARVEPEPPASPPSRPAPAPSRPRSPATAAAWVEPEPPASPISPASATSPSRSAATAARVEPVQAMKLPPGLVDALAACFAVVEGELPVRQTGAEFARELVWVLVRAASAGVTTMTGTPAELLRTLHRLGYLLAVPSDQVGRDAFKMLAARTSLVRRIHHRRWRLPFGDLLNPESLLREELRRYEPT